MAIGICDWGIGGAGLYKMLRSFRSNADIVYISDSGFTPYGKVSAEELKLQLEKVFQHFHSLGIDHIAVACNAASTVVNSDNKIRGIIGHGIDMMKNVTRTEIGIVGGIRTIESNVYKDPLEAMGFKVIQQIAQPLSARVEAGDIDSEELDEVIKTIFEPLSDLRYIMLACTHYPAVYDRIQQVVPRARLLCPEAWMGSWIADHWSMKGKGTIQWMTTGDAEQMQYALKRSFNLDADTIEKIIL